MSVNPGRPLLGHREALINSIVRALCANEARPLKMADVRALHALVARLVTAFLASMDGSPDALVDQVFVMTRESLVTRRPDVLLSALELLDERASDLAMTTLNLDRADRDLRRVSQTIRPARDELARILCANDKKTTGRAEPRSIS